MAEDRTTGKARRLQPGKLVIATHNPGKLAEIGALVKRLVREAFRLGQHALPAAAPGPYDFVVVVRPHEPLTLDQYRAAFGSAVRHLHSTWQKRAHRKSEPPREDPGSSPAP